VLVIHTGGTLGSWKAPDGRLGFDKDSKLSFEAHFKHLFECFQRNGQYREFKPPKFFVFPEGLDSSQMQPYHWQLLVEILRTKSRTNKYCGFVITHGTDTLAYTASALTFLLKNFKESVILTAAQVGRKPPIRSSVSHSFSPKLHSKVPIFQPHTDGWSNLMGAIECASGILTPVGIRRLPGVFVYFNRHLFMGTRIVKTDAAGFNAFSSPKIPPVAESTTSGLQVNWLLLNRVAK
jgi:L-asparaginase